MYNDFLYYQLYKDIIYLDITAMVCYKIYFKLVKAGGAQRGSKPLARADVPTRTSHSQVTLGRSLKPPSILEVETSKGPDKHLCGVSSALNCH